VSESQKVKVLINTYLNVNHLKTFWPALGNSNNPITGWLGSSRLRYPFH